MTTRYIVMVVAIILFLAWMLWIGLHTRKWVSGMDDYLVAGREVGTIPLAVGLFSIIAAGTTFSGATGLGYTNGMGGAMWGLSWATAAMLCAIFFTALVRASGGFTLPEWLGMKYGRKTQIAVSIPQTIGSILSGAAQIIGSAFILCGLTGWSYTMAVVISGVIVLAYTYFGGLWAVVYTELIQGVFCVAAIVITLAFCMVHFGGFSFLEANLEASYFTYPGALGWGPPQGNWALLTTIGCIFGYIMIVIPNTYIWTKTASSRSNKTAIHGFVIAAILCVLFLTWPIALIGMYGKAAGLELENSQMVFGSIIQMLPIGLDAIVLIGILAAIMSTASGAAIGAGASATRDLYQAMIKPNAKPEEMTKASKFITFICWLFIIGIALACQDLGTLQMLGLSFAYFSIACPGFIASFYFPSVKKSTVFWSVIPSLIVTTIYVLFFNWNAPPYYVHPMWIGCGSSLLLLIVIHLFNRKESEPGMPVEKADKEEVLNLIAKGRTQMAYLMDATLREGKYVQSAVTELIGEGLVCRQKDRGMGYQIVNATQAGQARVRYVHPKEQELVEEYGISWECLVILKKAEALVKQRGNTLSLQNMENLQAILPDGMVLKNLKTAVMFMNCKGAVSLGGLMRATMRLNGTSKEILSKYGGEVLS